MATPLFNGEPICILLRRLPGTRLSNLFAINHALNIGDFLKKLSFFKKMYFTALKTQVLISYII